MNNLKPFHLYALNENEALLNSILDKISANGIDSLSPRERQFLNNQKDDVVDTDLETRLDVDNGNEFRSLRNPTLGFSYHNTTTEDFYIIHMGVLHVNDNNYSVALLCDENDGSFSHAHFDDEDVDVKWGLGAMDEEAEVFLANEVCPVLAR